MSKHLQGTRAQCDAWFQAINDDAGLPLKGRTVGGPERVNQVTPSAGWTTAICLPVLEVNPGLAGLEVPDDQLTRLGRTVGPTTLPPQANAQDVTALPPGLRTLVYARMGLDANGIPIPISVGQAQAEAKSG